MQTNDSDISSIYHFLLEISDEDSGLSDTNQGTLNNAHFMEEDPGTSRDGIKFLDLLHFLGQAIFTTILVSLIQFHSTTWW